MFLSLQSFRTKSVHSYICVLFFFFEIWFGNFSPVQIVSLVACGQRFWILGLQDSLISLSFLYSHATKLSSPSNLRTLLWRNWCCYGREIGVGTRVAEMMVDLIVRELSYAGSLYLRNKSEDAYISQAY